jgi:hypothetical protein
MLLLIVAILFEFTGTAAAGETYYVDCSAGSDVASGKAPVQAWKTLEKVSASAFQPGDSILFRRGVRCSGSLWPKGSGEEGLSVVKSPSRLNWLARNRKTAQNLRHKKVEGSELSASAPPEHTPILLMEKGVSFTE